MTTMIFPTTFVSEATRQMVLSELRRGPDVHNTMHNPYLGWGIDVSPAEALLRTARNILREMGQSALRANEDAVQTYGVMVPHPGVDPNVPDQAWREFVAERMSRVIFRVNTNDWRAERVRRTASLHAIMARLGMDVDDPEFADIRLKSAWLNSHYAQHFFRDAMPVHRVLHSRYGNVQRNWWRHPSAIHTLEV